MDTEFKRRMSPSLALMTLAALTPRDHKVTLADENIKPVHTDDSPDLVGITVNVDTSLRAYQIAAQYRARKIPVVLGGIHVSANPQEAQPHADALCIGEADELWPSICQDTLNHCLKPVYQGTQAANPVSIPIPKWEVIDSSQYLYTNIICSSRGCPFRCEFCYNSCDYVHSGVRNRPVSEILREIEKLGTRHVMFIDDNFIGNLDWTREFMRAIQSMNLTWNAAVSSNIIHHPDVMDQMQQTGCRSLFIGFESINSRSITSVQKHQNHIQNYETLIRELHQRDIMINASLVFGFDYDYPDVFKNTLNWLVSNKIETVTAHILTPYPGTALYKKFTHEDRIVDHDPTHYNTAHVVYEPKNMSREELYRGYLWVYNQFYSLKNIYRRLPDSRSQRMPYLMFNLMYRKFGRLTSRIMSGSLMQKAGRLGRRLSYGID